MSISRTVNITCPSCGTKQDVRLYEAVNVQTDPELKTALMQNQLNRVECVGCESNFRVDLPLLYNDPANKILIHWVSETPEMGWEQILEDFEISIEKMNESLPENMEMPVVRLVLTRVELVELIYMIEAGLNQRVVEYVKYNIFSRNLQKISPHKFRLLLNVEDSNDEELCFVQQDVVEQTLGTIVRYGRQAYDSMSELFAEDPAEFMDMFPGPCISARNLLLEDEQAGE